MNRFPSPASLRINKITSVCVGVRSALVLPGSPPYHPQAARAGERSALGAPGAGCRRAGIDVRLLLSQPPSREQSGDPGVERE